jgi:hypothetical protein
VHDEQAAALLAGWREEERRHHEGWDFSHLAGRVAEEHPPSRIAGPSHFLNGRY